MRRRSLRCAGIFLALLLVATGARVETWRAEPLATDEEGASAVAVAGDGRVALGDGRGAWLREAAGVWRRIGPNGAVRDLAFARDGALWIASSAGLVRFADGRDALRMPAPGERARDASRVAAAGRVVAVATGAGVFWSLDGERFARVEVPVGESPPGGLALEASPGDTILWIATERGLFAASLPAGETAVGTRAERVALPVDLRPALDVWTAAGRVLALGRTWLLVRGGGDGFVAHRLEIPPGATPTRVDAAGDGVWIATDRGALAAPEPGAGFARAATPAGETPAADVAIGGGHVWIAGARGLLVGTPAERSVQAGTGSPCDPPILAVQRVALDYLRLRGDPAGAMRRGVRLRGLLPVVTLEGHAARDSDRSRNYDEAFISGAYHHLYDTDEARARDRALGLRLIWDLGDLAYNDEQVDVSTEARRLVELRDDVLDEVNQLYFDRQRALAAAQAAPPDAPEAARERLRAAELAAGLDAWTDGWFGASTCASP
jgi:hypothetical protein